MTSIQDLVARVQTETPLPARYEDLPAALRRDVERRAREANLTAEQVYSAIRAQAEVDAEGNASTADVVAAVQRTRRGTAG